MPVSATVTRSSGSPSADGSIASVARTLPVAVNLTALPSRLSSIWRQRDGSSRICPGRSAGTSHTSSSPLACADGATTSMASCSASRGSKSTASSVSLPASIFEKSRMSLMIVTRLSADRWICSAYSRCSEASGVSSSRLTVPMTPFIGVRISWLTVARKALLALAASSAASRAAASCRSIWRRRSISLRRSLLTRRAAFVRRPPSSRKWAPTPANTASSRPTPRTISGSGESAGTSRLPPRQARSRHSGAPGDADRRPRQRAAGGPLGTGPVERRRPVRDLDAGPPHRRDRREQIVVQHQADRHALAGRAPAASAPG